MSRVRTCRAAGAVTAALLAALGLASQAKSEASSEAQGAASPLVIERATGATYITGRAYMTGDTHGDIKKVRDGIYLIAGAGANITVQIGPEGVVLVDTGRAESAQAVLAAVRTLTATPVTLIVNTCYQLDHTGGNAAISAASRTATAFWYAGVQAVQTHATIWAHESVLSRLASTDRSGQPLVPQSGWPLDTYFTPHQNLFFNDEPVQLYYEPHAHTDGDTIVFFRRSDVIATGDIFNTSRYPMIRGGDGGGIEGEIAALNHIIDLAVPDRNEEGGTIVIPGYGHIADQDDVVIYRDAVTIIRDRIAALIKRGMSLEQVRKARPTQDYDGDYGADEGPWTTEMFVEAVYRDLRGRH